MSRLGIPSKQKFVNATTLKETSFANKVKKSVKGRGAKMALIDVALGEWEALYNTTNMAGKLKALSHLVSACSWWLSLKAAKQSELGVQRKLQVDILLKLALKALNQLDVGHGAVAKNKSAAIRGGQVRAVADTKAKTLSFAGVGTKSLAPGYAAERDLYVRTDKQLAVAGGAIHDEWDKTGKAWKDVTSNDYWEIFNKITNDRTAWVSENEVAYLAKADRVQYLAMPVGQAFQRPDGTAVYSAGFIHTRLGDMWAMDRYGNLFVKDSKGINGKGYFNHSSFCAGLDVICAGVVMFNHGGVLAYLDNSSGHYKPSRYDLHAALNRLLNEGIPMQNVRVGVLVQADQPPVCYKALDFLANPDSQPNWDPNMDAALNLPDVVSG